MQLSVSIDGQVVGPEQATISVFDHGFLFGDSVYEVVRTYGGRPFRLEQHLARLHRSAAAIKLPIPWSDEELEGYIRATIAAAQPGDGEEAYVRYIVTRGPGPVNLSPKGCDRQRLIIIAKPLVGPTEAQREKGIRVALAQTVRTSPAGPGPTIKTGNYLNSMLALMEAEQLGVDEALMCDRDGYLTECPTANVFFVDRDGVLKTPHVDVGILPGITRSEVLEVAAELGIQSEEGLYHPSDLLAATEAFITSTTRELVPIAQVDQQPIGHPAHRPMTRQLLQGFWARVEQFLATKE